MPAHPKARVARWIGLAAMGTALAGAGVAAAQPRGRPAKKAVDDGGAAPAPPPPPAAVADAGPVPAPTQDESIDGGKLSPLNPAPNEFSDAAPAPDSVDYDRLLADVAALRARVAAVSDTLFHSRIAIAVEARGDHARVAALSVSLDDGVVWTSPASFRPSDPTTVYEHAVAPGHHAVTIDVERRDDRNDVFRSSQRSRFIVDVPADQKLAVELQVTDDSAMGADFPADHKGQYELRVRARAQARSLGR
jgi:hypothetical protein